MHAPPTHVVTFLDARKGILSLIILSSLFFCVFVAPEFLPIHLPVGGDITNAHLPPFSNSHLLGTDMYGNDVLSRLLYGGRTSIAIAVSVNLLGMLLGGTLGASSAFLGGYVDTVLMRVMDALLAIPALILVLAASQLADPTIITISAALTCFSVPAFARVSRATTLALLAAPFMTSARLNGCNVRRALWGHVMPNIARPLCTFCLLGVGMVMSLEGALNYLGFGIRMPAPSWGGMIFQGQQVLSVYPQLVILPSFCLFLTILAFNLLGQSLQSERSRHVAF